MKITIPELSLVAMIGPTGSGKSTFARKHFPPTEVLSSDYCRGLVSDDENSQAATNDAFEVLYFIAAKRLAAARLTVIDATNVQREARKPIVELARRYHCLPVAIVLNLPEDVCHQRNRGRADRAFGPHVARQQAQQLRRSLRGLKDEGFRHVFVLSTPEEIAAAEVVRQPLWNNLKQEHGPFDMIGDVHGCREELEALLGRLGYVTNGGAYRHPGGRKAVFLGDLVDRGPDTPGVLKIAMSMTAEGAALCVPGNHDIKLMRKLRGRDVKITHGLAESLAQLDREPPEFRVAVEKFIDARVSHYVLDDGKLVVAHAGLSEELQGRGSGKVRDFALYGETTGETDEYGLPVRYNWAAEYRGRATVVYGHTPVPEPEWLNNTVCVDTGCVFGGRLTALRYPEREFVSVPAAREYYAPAKPLAAPSSASAAGVSAQHEVDDLLDAADVIGKRIISTRLHHTVTIREEQAMPAWEVMSRFAVDPKWLIYLPPTMSPSETTSEPGLLEHPREAFAYYRKRDVAQVVCEEKHMGSRAVVVICRDEDAARRRFGVVGQGPGVVYTRTGRRFFDSVELEREMLARIIAACTSAGIWDEFATDWVCPGCGADAVVGEGAGAGAPAVRGGGRGGTCRGGGGGIGAWLSVCSCSRDGRALGAVRRPCLRGPGLQRGVPAVLLARALARGPEAGAVPSAGDGGPHPFRPRPRLAHGDAGASGGGRFRPADGDAVPRRHAGGRLQRVGRHDLVGGADGPRRRRYGRQAPVLRGP
jgi:protein phosphatase